MKYLIIAATILAASCTKKDKCYTCEHYFNRGIPMIHYKDFCGTKDEMKEYEKRNTQTFQGSVTITKCQ